MRELNIFNIVNILEGKYFLETSKNKQKSTTLSFLNPLRDVSHINIPHVW